MREAAKLYGVEALITDDYLEVEAHVAELQPELVLGTQMERHIAKRLGMPCAVISAPVHVQDFPARYSPQMGFEGANVLFDTWVHPLMMGLEEHLLTMFRDDFEFHDGAAAVAPGPHAAGRAHGRRHRAPPTLRSRPTCQQPPPSTPRWPPRLHGRWRRAAPSPPGAPRLALGAERKGTAEDPLLRARQGPPQHRDASRPNVAWP